MQSTTEQNQPNIEPDKWRFYWHTYIFVQIVHANIEVVGRGSNSITVSFGLTGYIYIIIFYKIKLPICPTQISY